ncbi:DNA methyltransferase [Hydrogenivirga sp. 128-5-R1-1]|uniref:DNA methyltransferase n=1 Tax=Hydrogenivirga sp. 128-5-R1-1 TaxID=392423 RepID=UPI00015EF1E5|nr:DNA methyltransferase [Hydrogenivirga sp. 128-5-R1-1]EDP74654.1 probable methylation subunit, type III restriction-modification system [Hydrogenivirga sp. 128-5-R1-1]
MEAKYTDIDCSTLEGKDKFLCLMKKEIFWFDKPELSFGVYKVFRKKQTLIDKVLKEVVEGLERTFDEGRKFEELKKNILESVGDKLSALERGKIEECNDKSNLGKILKEIRNAYTEELKRAEGDKAKIVIQETLNSIDDALTQIDTTELVSSVDIYNHLYNFFSLYYNKGDFGYTKNRYSVYQVSYEEKDFVKEESIEHTAWDYSATEEYDGRDVLFRWQSWDTYYIKTLKYAKDYEIKDIDVFGRIVTIKLTIDLENSEQSEGNSELKLNESHYDDSNNLLILKFVLSKEETPVEEIIEEIFKALNIEIEEIEVRNPETDKEAKLKVKDVAKEGSKKILTSRKAFLDSKNMGFPDNSKVDTKEKVDKVFEENKELETLWKLLRGIALFKEGTDSDYFIHKNLKRFLTKELDKYIKNRIFADTDDLLNNPQALNKALKIARLFKDSAQRIIDVLAQMEDFQKKLWELRKLVKRAEYVISSKEIEDEEVLELVFNNDSQKREWEELGIPLPESVEDLKEKSYPIDTKHFGFEDKYRILSAIDDLEDKVRGVLIKSENFQALRFLEPKYRGKVKTIYIDPPYNAKSSEILYKNTFKHSSWLSLMENRLALGKEFLREEDGVFVVAIDENEQERLGLLIEELFPEYKKTMVAVVHNPSGIQGENFRYTNDFAYFIYPDKGRIMHPEERSEDEADVRQFMNTAKGNTKNYLRESGTNCFYPILVKDGEIVGFGEPLPLDIHPPHANIPRQDGVIEVYPIDDDGVERKWVYARQSVEKIKDELYAKYDERKKKWVIMRTKKLINYATIWDNKKYNAKKYGTELIKNMGTDEFKFPKSVWTVHDSIKISSNPDSLILDFFAGSGTTAHAVALLNTKEAKSIIDEILEKKKKLNDVKTEKTRKEKEEEIRALEEKLRSIEFENRRYILVEINDYFDTVIIPRIKRLMYSLVWKEGKPQYPFGYSHVFKYLYLEQYEDLLEIYGDMEIEGGDTDTEYIFSKDFTQLTNVRIKPLIKKPVNNPKYDLLETYIFHKNLELEKVRYENGILMAQAKDGYGNSILILLSNERDRLIDFINREDLSNYGKVVVNLDIPDQEKIENNLDKLEFIKTSDLAGV